MTWLQILKWTVFAVALLPLGLDLFLLAVGIYIGNFTNQPPDHGGAYLMVSGMLFMPVAGFAGIGTIIALLIPNGVK